MSLASSPLDHASNLQALRRAFRDGITPASADLLLQALDAGVGWESATTAVAEGLAERAHAGGASPPEEPRPRRRHASAGARAVLNRSRHWLYIPATLALYTALRPVIGASHQLTIATLAWLAHSAVATGWWLPIVGLLQLDPVYAGAAVRAAGGVDVLGFAVAGPVGAWLHQVWPAVCTTPEQVARGAAVSMVAAPGTPALGRALAAFSADVVLLALGMALFWTWRRRLPAVALFGLLLQGQVAIKHLFGAQVSLPDLEASGLPFALALATPVASHGVWFTTLLHSAGPEWQDLTLGSVLLLLGYASAVLLLLLVYAAGACLRRPSRRQRSTRLGARPNAGGSMVRVGVVAAVLVALSPVGALAIGQPNWQVSAASNAGASPHAAGRLPHVTEDPRAAGPSEVQIVANGSGGWDYLVNGQPTVIRGAGYNPQYASLEASARTALYERDFSSMHQRGINTIEGWFEPQFDEVTLDAAARNGIGVIMPFEINQDWDLTNANIRQSILDHVSDLVERYKDHPAVRMWAPGNENLHRILYPHWVSQANDPTVRARADAFAAFLPTLVDRIHALDPNHPVLYRDAEDVYLPLLKAPLQADGVARPWFVYGANVYSSVRLRDVIAAWPAQGFSGPLLISEFAPGGVGPQERPLGFEQQWATIRSRPDIVIGGLAYTWATNGPEELDRVFGLVDADGVPTDAALDALSTAYLSS